MSAQISIVIHYPEAVDFVKYSRQPEDNQEVNLQKRHQHLPHLVLQVSQLLG